MNGLVSATLREAADDHVWRHAAAVAYYALFALGPFLVLLLMLASALAGADAAHAAFFAPLHRLLGPGGSKALDDFVEGARKQGPGAWGVALGSAALLVGAAGAFAQLKEALNAVWDVARKPRGSWGARLATALRENLLSVGGVLAALFLLLASLALGGVGAALRERLPGAALVSGALALVATLLLVALAVALLFKLVPDADVAWRDAWVGAAVTSVALAASQWALGEALAITPIATAYGVAGAAMALLLWVYVCALVVLVGAAFTQVWANRHGEKVRPDPDAEPRAEALARRERPS